jgi:hypothetical protein
MPAEICRTLEGAQARQQNTFFSDFEKLTAVKA